MSKFDVQAAQWWDPKGVAAPLHRMNPTRVSHIRSVIQRTTLLNSDVLDKRTSLESPLKPLTCVDVVDVGCGGGLVTEPLARLGANVLGIDMSTVAIDVARVHKQTDPLLVLDGLLEYEKAAVEDLVSRGSTFDAVLALEIIEHVEQPDQFLIDCASLVNPGGVLIMSTLNRTTASWLLGIVAAEQILRWLPRGTHDWNKFVSPDDVRNVLLERTELIPHELVGVNYNPLTRRFSITDDTSVNYILSATRPLKTKESEEPGDETSNS